MYTVLYFIFYEPLIDLKEEKYLELISRSLDEVVLLSVGSDSS